MNPGSPGSHSNDSIQDDDFLDSVSHMSDAKRRRVVEAGGMAGCNPGFSSAGHFLSNNTAYEQNQIQEKSARLTAAAPSVTVRSLIRGDNNSYTPASQGRDVASLQEELRALQKEAVRRGVLVQPVEPTPDSHHVEGERLLVQPHASAPNRMVPSSQLQFMILQALQQQRQEMNLLAPPGPVSEQGRHHFTAAGMLSEARHDIQGMLNSSYVIPNQGNNVQINSDALGISGPMDVKVSAQFTGGAITDSMLQSSDKKRTAGGPLDSAPSKATRLLYNEFDVDILSDYQCLVRKNIEIFEAGASEIESTAKGRNKPILLGQVGIRCRHCSWMDPRTRKKGAMYYPAKLSGIYQAAQSLASSHLCNHCDQIPQELRKQLHILKERKSSAGGGKDYWSDSARIVGVHEDPERGLYYRGKNG